MFSYVLEKPTATTYSPTLVNKMDVLFKSVQQPNGNKTYIALVDDLNDEDAPLNNNCTVADTEFSKLYKQGEIYATPTPTNDDENDDIFSLGNDSIKIFYIGSITVVGLYILFRILSKTK